MEPWRILVVDDNAAIADQIAEVIRTDRSRSKDVSVIVEVEASFQKALELVDAARIDLLVLDVRDQGVAEESGDTVDADEEGSDVTEADAGLTVFHKVRDRRFVPVIFYTGLPNLVDATIVRSPFVQVVSKIDSESTMQLRAAVTAVLSSTLPAVHRALIGHVETIVREFMSSFVEEHWDELEAPDRRGDLAHLLLRRLALSLADGGEILSSRLGNNTTVALSEDRVHPMRFYILPPVGDLTTGDIVVGSASRQTKKRDAQTQEPANGDEPPPTMEGEDAAAPSVTWYVILTPACDLVPTRLKADFVVVAECVPLETSPEYAAWAKTRPHPSEEAPKASITAEKSLGRLMHNKRDNRPADRDYFLPAAWSVPNLIVDFQRISSVTLDDLTSGYRRVATLDSPYVDALVETFSRYLGRRGTPDLDESLSIALLEPPDATAAATVPK